MNTLSAAYDEIKAGSRSQMGPGPLMNIGPGTPGALAWKRQAQANCEQLKDQCLKRIVLDIYVKCLPLDKDYIDGNQGIIKQDVDNFLGSKGMTPRQYITSAHEKTKAPLLEYILQSVDNIGKQFMEEAEEILKDAQANDITPPPPEGDVEDIETQNALVDIKKDVSYDNFVDELKQKTVDKIVTDISELIAKEKEGDEMRPRLSGSGTSDDSFGDMPTMEGVKDTAQRTVNKAKDVVQKTKDKIDKHNEKGFQKFINKKLETLANELDKRFQTESTIVTVYDYVVESLWKENIELTPELNEEIIGMAIREAVLNQLDLVFKQPMSDFTNFRSTIRFGKGVVVNESVVKDIQERRIANEQEPDVFDKDEEDEGSKFVRDFTKDKKGTKDRYKPLAEL